VETIVVYPYIGIALAGFLGDEHILLNINVLQAWIRKRRHVLPRVV